MTGLDERYPRTAECDGQSFDLRLMQVADRDLVEQFAAELPRHDLLFLSRDIREPRVIDAWAEQIVSGEITSLVAEADGKMVGCTAIVRDVRSWSPHVGEVRVLLGEAQRKVGLGRQLIQESVWVAAAEGLEKLTARMTSDQTGALAVFRDLGFKPEGVLRDHVKDEEGTKHDLLLLGFDVVAHRARAVQFGLDEAFV